MAHMYVDPYAILDVTYLVVAFLFNGHGEDDGEYMIGCVLDLGETTERVALLYPTQQTRDAAFLRWAAWSPPTRRSKPRWRTRTYEARSTRHA